MWSCGWWCLGLEGTVYLQIWWELGISDFLLQIKCSANNQKEGSIIRKRWTRSDTNKGRKRTKEGSKNWENKPNLQNKTGSKLREGLGPKPYRTRNHPLSKWNVAQSSCSSVKEDQKTDRHISSSPDTIKESCGFNLLSYPNPWAQASGSNWKKNNRNELPLKDVFLKENLRTSRGACYVVSGYLLDWFGYT